MRAVPLLLSLTCAAVVPAADPPAPAKPNIVIIYADDLGYGDVGCYGSTRIPTPNIDRLAAEGLRFTNGHATSATCTPSRYALLTGAYPWRVGARILSGDAGMIIKPGTTTLPSLMHDAGYRTAVIGKWHLGLGAGKNDWNKPISPGPLELGFGYSFVMAATMDRVPCVYVRGHDVVGLDPADPLEVSYTTPFPGLPLGRTSAPGSLRMTYSHGHDGAVVNGVPRIGYVKGGTAATWVDEDMAEVYNREAVRFIEASKDQPFILYLAHSDPHVPRLPNKRFAGATGLGPRGDSVVQFDWSVGDIMDNLRRLGLDRNTLVVLTSDNGPVLDDGYQDGAVEQNGDHRPWGDMRGGKYSLYEAGTRVPFIVRWPERVQPGVSDALVCQVDFAASFASLAGRPLLPQEVPDSLDLLPALLGESAQGRDHLITDASGLGVLQGTWKYIAPGRAGRSRARNGDGPIASGTGPQPSLFDLAHDVHEDTDLAAQQPERVAAMQALIDEAKKAGHTRPW